MAWTAPMTFVSNTVLTAAQMNTYVRDNMNCTAPALATTAGYHFVSTGPNSIAERAIETKTIKTGETTTSTDFTDLATVGPQITCNTGTKVLLFVTAQTYNQTSDRATYMNVKVTGASTIDPVKEESLIIDGLNQSQLNTMRATTVIMRDDLTPGENTFTCQYRVNVGTGYWSNRNLTVIAL